MRLSQETHEGREPRRYVLVGYDGSGAGEQALHWAVQEARLRYLPLAVCHGYQWPFDAQRVDDVVLDAMQRSAKAVVETGVLIASRLDPNLHVQSRLARGSPSAVLIDQSRDAEVLVVGNRGVGGFEDMRVGSVPIQVSAHAAHPTIVVPEGWAGSRDRRRRVVVGVDGSPASEAALGFACEEAALRRESLYVVSSWQDLGIAAEGTGRLAADAAELRRETTARVQRMVAPWLEKYRHVAAEIVFVSGPPREVLSQAGVGATLLVVGDRGLGSAPELQLGPVAHTVLHQAPCPVAITHAAYRPGTRPG